MIRIELVRQNLDKLADELLEHEGSISDWELLEVVAHRTLEKHMGGMVEFYRKEPLGTRDGTHEVIYTPQDILVCIRENIECRAKPKED